MKLTNILISICIAAGVLFSNQSLGQKPGTLTGKVRDQTTNEPLSGTSISQENSSKGTVSQSDGTYTLKLTPGTYTFQFSMNGYKTKKISGIVITSDETTFLDILLEVSNKNLEAVVVTTTVKKETQSSLYSLQKRSAAASDGITLEAINRTPDNQAGQVLKRVTGVNMLDNKFVVVRGLGEQYNQTMLNGVPMTSTENNKNAFSFDLIPAAAVDNIVVNKTATPDMPGSFAGGIVQINTKDFPAKQFLSITTQIGFSDETLGKDFIGDKRSNLQFLGFDGGTRKLPEGFPTNTSKVPFLRLNSAEQIRYLTLLQNNLVPVNHGPSGPNEQVQLGFGTSLPFKNGSQFGIVASINQRKIELIETDVNMRNPEIGEEFFVIPEVQSFYTDPNNANREDVSVVRNYSENTRYKYQVDFGGVLNLAYRYGNTKITLKNLFSQVYNDQYIDRNYVSLKGYTFQPAYDYRLFGLVYTNSSKRIINSTLSGEHRTGNKNETRLDWNTSVTQNKSAISDTRNFIFGTDSLNSIIGINPNIFRISDFLSQASRTWNNLKDLTISGAFNITSPFLIKGNKQIFKSGILFQNRDRTNRATIIPFSDMEGTLSTVFSTENILNRRTATDNSVTGLAEQGGDYNAGSSLLAAYESIENNIGKKLRVIWGIRLEKYQQSSNVFNATYYPGFDQMEPVVKYFASRTEFNFLPSINAIYSPNTKMNVRGAFSRTVIRPDLKDLVNIPIYDIVNFRLTIGNPDLRSTKITNYDLKWEWFPSAGEIISIAAFYKDMLDPIEYIIPEDQVRYSEVSGVPINTGNAYATGIEVEIRKRLDFIKSLPWLKNVSVFGNGSLLKSKVYTQPTTSIITPTILEHSLTGQPNYIINAGMTISMAKNTFEITGNFNRTGDYIGELGRLTLIDVLSVNPNFNNLSFVRQASPNFIVKGRNLVDIVVSKTLIRNKLKIKFNIVNLLKQPYILYQDLNNNGKYDEQLEIGGGFYKIGNSLNVPYPTRYASGIDSRATSLNAQRTYELSFSYTF